VTLHTLDTRLIVGQLDDQDLRLVVASLADGRIDRRASFPISLEEKSLRQIDLKKGIWYCFLCVFLTP
jgi:hypothetical protein